MISFKRVSSCTEMLWITLVLVWGQRVQPCTIKPLDRGVRGHVLEEGRGVTASSPVTE